MVKAFNNWLAIKLSDYFSTMACFYAFCILALFPLVYPQSLAVVQFVSSGFLQLVALPLLAVAAKIIQEQQQELHTNHAEMLEMHEQHAADLAALHLKHDELHDHIKGRPDASSE